MWSYCELFICSFGELLGTILFLVVVSFPSGLGNSALNFLRQCSHDFLYLFKDGGGGRDS